MKFQSGSSHSQHKQQFFNQSFYRQRIDQQSSNKQINQNIYQNSYISYQFTKRYFQATRINQIINRSVRTTLESPYLPQNPYNMIGRLILHQSIFQNIRAYYSMYYSEKAKRDQQEINLAMSEMADQKKVMKDIKIGNKFYTVGWRLSPLIKIDRISALWPLFFEQRQAKKKSKKSKITDISYCLGGSLILKVGSPYSAQQNLIPTVLVTMAPSQNMQHITQFADFVIDDCIKICESPNNIFIKLYIYTHRFTTTEWSAQNLIHNRTKIAKQIYKSCMSNTDELKVDYIIKLPAQAVKSINTTYARVSKTYVLIQQQDKQAKIHSRRPTTILLTSVFNQQSLYFQNVMQAFDNKGSLQQLVHQMQSQIHDSIIYCLQQQQPSWVGWCLFYSTIYNFTENVSRDKQLKSLITYMMDSPLGFIDQLRHQINVTKLMSGRSSSASHQLQIVQLLEKSQKRIRMYIQKQQHIYPETVIFFNAVKRNLQLILQHKNKHHNIKPILQRIQLLIKYLLNSFYQICFVLKGHLLNQIVKIDNQFGKDGSGEIISNTVTYDIFLRKYKDLPDRTLNLTQQIGKLKQQYMRPDDDLRQLILAKYVQQYKLYDQIYQFYWAIICGKKLSYPMGQFVTLFRNQAIRFDARRYRKNKDIKYDIEQTKTDGIMIYQKSADSRGQHLFYSLKSQGLQDNQVNNYRQIKQIFQQYFQNDIISQKSTQSLAHLQKNSYILSISSNIGRISSEQADFNKCKIYIDSIYHVPINPTQIYRIMYMQIVQKLELLDKNGFGVIGIYNGQKQFMDQDQVSPWIEHQQKYDISYLRYQSKKQLNIQSVTKLLKTCKSMNAQIIIRGIFWLNGLLKSCEISINFLINKQWLINNASSYEYRIFTKHEDIARWGNYNGLKQYIVTHKKIEDNPKFNRRQSIKQKYMNNHIDMIQFVAQDMQKPIQIARVRTYSPFYTQLQQSLSLVQSLFYLLQYVKIDRYGKYQVKDFKDTVQILQYYLFDKCLRMDRYIYSEGLSVSIINMIGRIHKYLQDHPDNNGQQKQLICLQKITIKLMNSIHYVLTSCAFGVIEAVTSHFVDQSDSDDD